MLKIDRVGQSSTHTYHFPTIDFKFQNTGTATAFLWKFVIEVLHAEIDTMPVLSFYMRISNRLLYIFASNDGWGTAHDCQVRISEPILNQLYADSMLQYIGTIGSGEDKLLLSFQHDLADQEKFTAVSKKLLLIKDDNNSYWPQDFTVISEELVDQFSSRDVIKHVIRGIRLKESDIAWKCRDDKNIQHTENVKISDSSVFFLTEKGFYHKFHNSYSSLGPADSDVTYSTILDPSKGCHERAYPISRKVSSGDVERFHIMVGAPMSCHLSIRFKFFIDQTTMVESEVFDVKIWNPRNSKWHSNYKDGEALNRISYERRDKKYNKQ